MRGRLTLLVCAATALTALFLLGPECTACTSFCLERDGTVVFAKNYDWEVEVGRVMVNPKGLQKRALPSENPATWSSRYGSVTFNQYGRELPSGGVNERGLAIEVLWLEETVYCQEDERPAVTPLQWIQYLLDNCGNVEEALVAQKEIRIPQGNSVPVHFLLCDASGACAAVEFLGGEPVIHTGDDMPFPVLTNDTYGTCARYLSEHAGFGGDRLPAAGNLSKDRFVRVSVALAQERKAGGAGAVQEAFTILGGVASPEYTVWSIVYDLGNRRVYFRTRSHGAIREIDLDDFDFSCSRPALVLDMNEELAGPARGRFVPCTTEANRALIREAYGATDFLQSISEDALESLAGYPDAFPCTE